MDKDGKWHQIERIWTIFFMKKFMNFPTEDFTDSIPGSSQGGNLSQEPLKDAQNPIKEEPRVT